MTKIKTENVSDAVTGNISSLSKGNTSEKTVIEYVEDDIDELPDSDYTKASVRVFDEIYNEKAGVLPL